MSEEPKSVATVDSKIEKKRKLESYIYPSCELAGGIYKSYFSSYLSMLLTNVYMFSATLSAILETARQLSSYIISPLSAYIVDHSHFKSGKYWPYIMFCLTGMGIGYIILFSLPVLAADASKLAILVLIINLVILILSNLGTNACRQIYARTCKTQKERTNASMYAKVTRDGMKTIVGLIYPVLLVSLIAKYNDEPKAWAAVAVVLAVPAIFLYIANGVWVKNSQFEKDNVALHTAQKASPTRKKSSLAATLKGIFANRHMLCAFFAYALTKLSFFIFLTGGSYTWRYYFENFSYFSFFSSGAGLCAIIGAFATPFCRKLFKEIKYTWVGSLAIQSVFMVIALFVYRQSNPIASMIIIFAVFFFNGVTDTISMPIFVGASDWANWKFKTNDVGLTMAVWGLALNLGTLSNTWIRAYVLNKGGFDAATLKAGAPVPEALKQALWTYNTIVPLACMVLAALFILVGYGLKDEDINRYRKENAERLGTK